MLTKTALRHMIKEIGGKLRDSQAQLLAKRLTSSQQPDTNASGTDSRRVRDFLRCIPLQRPLKQSPVTSRAGVQHLSQIDSIGIESVRGFRYVFERHGSCSTKSSPVKVSS